MKQQEYVINGQRFVVEIISFDGKNAQVNVNGTSYRVEVPSSHQADQQAVPPPLQSVSTTPKQQQQAPQQPSRPPTPRVQPTAEPAAPPKPQKSSGPTSSENSIVSPMPGTVLKIMVEQGQSVKAGEAVLILEAMKMENEIHSPRDGNIKTIHVPKGAEVQAGAPLIDLE